LRSLWIFNSISPAWGGRREDGHRCARSYACRSVRSLHTAPITSVASTSISSCNTRVSPTRGSGPRRHRRGMRPRTRTLQTGRAIGDVLLRALLQEHTRESRRWPRQVVDPPAHPKSPGPQVDAYGTPTGISQARPTSPLRRRRSGGQKQKGPTPTQEFGPFHEWLCNVLRYCTTGSLTSVSCSRHRQSC
jgi:hypothetical protein